MAISLKRALFSSRFLFDAIRIASISSHQTVSYSISFCFGNSHEVAAVVDRFLTSSATDYYQFVTRRGLAKGRKQPIKEEDEDDEDEEEEDEEDYDEDDEKGGDLGATVKDAAVSQMITHELAKLRTGRASTGILDHIMVEHYGVKTPLNRIAVVSALKELEKAIITSPLGLNPKSNNQRLIVPIPSLTKEHTQAICKVVGKSSEDIKQSIRRVRQKVLDSIKKAAPRKTKDKAGKDKDKDKLGSSISEDDAKRLEKEFIKTAEDMCKAAKEKEIRGV